MEEFLLLLPGPSEAESFQLEMSGLLSELACPYAVLTSGDLSHRFLNRTDCLLLLSRTPTTFSHLTVDLQCVCCPFYSHFFALFFKERHLKRGRSIYGFRLI